VTVILPPVTVKSPPSDGDFTPSDGEFTPSDGDFTPSYVNFISKCLIATPAGVNIIAALGNLLPQKRNDYRNSVNIIAALGNLLNQKRNDYRRQRQHYRSARQSSPPKAE